MIIIKKTIVLSILENIILLLFNSSFSDTGLFVSTLLMYFIKPGHLFLRKSALQKGSFFLMPCLELLFLLIENGFNFGFLFFVQTKFLKSCFRFSDSYQANQNLLAVTVWQWQLEGSLKPIGYLSVFYSFLLTRILKSQLLQRRIY